MKTKWNSNLNEAPLFRTVLLDMTNKLTGDMRYGLGYLEEYDDDEYAFRVVTDDDNLNGDNWTVKRWLDPTRV